MQNMLRRSVTLPWAAARQEVDLTGGAAIHAIRLRITGQLDVAAGGGADGVLNQDPVVRLIRQIRITHDDYDIVDPMPLVPFFYFYRRTANQTILPVNPAIPGIQAATLFSATVVIPFSWKAFADPHEIFYRANRVARQFKLYIDWETAVAVAGDSPGSAAMITGGTRATTLSAVQVVVTEISSVTPKQPQLYPKFRYGQTQQFVAATAALPFQLLSGDRVAAHMLMEREGALEQTAALGNLNRVTLLSNQARKLDNLAFADLKEEERELFNSVPLAETGTVLVNYLDNGRFGGALDPLQLGTNPRYEFNVAVPTTAPGMMRVFEFALVGKPGETVLAR